MHYYGTFAMARSAGIPWDEAVLIATCAQFVDDNIGEGETLFGDGAAIRSEATAHHPIDKDNLDHEDQRNVWVPFHFLPGNEGDSFTERLKCRKDSMVVRELVDHYLDLAHQPFAAALMGITAHIYADTFSHYGFSGVSSRGNKIENDSIMLDPQLAPAVRDYIVGKAERFRMRPGARLLRNIKSAIADLAALGHGSVATYPDRPYLSWSFRYEREDAVHGTLCERNNRETFLEGCEALHSMFRRFAERNETATGEFREFSSIEGAVRDVLAVEGAKEVRIRAWQEASRAGQVGTSDGEEIPPYQGENWNREWQGFHKAESADAAVAHPVWRFYQAAKIHRAFVLRDLLPKHGLVVS